MKRLEPLPPRWPGVALILAGSLGLCFVVSPRAAGIALIVVVCAFCLFMALGAWAAVITAGHADNRMTEEEVSARGKALADKLRERIRFDEAESSASAVIGDDQ